MVMLEDLRIARHHLAPCFPEHYDIFQYCVDLYHTVVEERLKTIVDEGLEGQEYVSLLQWVEQTYPGPELMGSSALGMAKDKIPPLLGMCYVCSCVLYSLEFLHAIRFFS